MIRAENPFSSSEEPNEEDILRREAGIEHSKVKRDLKEKLRKAENEAEEIIKRAEEDYKRRN